MTRTAMFPAAFSRALPGRARYKWGSNGADGPVASEGPIETWRRRARFRRHLRRLLRDKPELLEDAGLAIEFAQRESGKLFWRK
jgi:uncharacterized protein YjiS (DUF1127 family)